MGGGGGEGEWRFKKGVREERGEGNERGRMLRKGGEGG